MKKLFKGLVVMAMALTIIAPTTVFALDADDLGVTYGEDIGLSDSDPRTIAGNLVKVILGFLGILAVIIILIGGFKWMTAAGNEDQVAEARKIIVAGIIGLVIILAAWGIANFVITALMDNI